MLSKNTVKRIIKNSNVFGAVTVIGKYTYTFDYNSGYIYRVKTDDKDRAFIDDFGNVFTKWEFVQKV